MSAREAAEQWRPTGDAGYEVSDDGRVRSWHHGDEPRLMSTFWDETEQCVRTCITVNGRQTMRVVAKLVLEAFVGPRPPLHKTRFKDGDRTNVHLSNLEWWRKPKPPLKGRASTKGEKNGHSKLTDVIVLEMRRRRADGCTYKQIATEFGMREPAVYLAVTGATWSHLPWAQPQIKTGRPSEPAGRKKVSA